MIFVLGVVNEKDGWNEESEKFAKIQLVCEECYFEMKELNK